jgi:hypothetical protein
VHHIIIVTFSQSCPYGGCLCFINIVVPPLAANGWFTGVANGCLRCQRKRRKKKKACKNKTVGIGH